MGAQPEPKFKIGQIVMVTGLKKPLPFKILAMHYDDGWFYAWNRRNYASEHMIRPLTADEIGS